ncbi:hypothetical protein BH09PSE5_BH09PSE5_49860 [soil metagenome]
MTISHILLILRVRWRSAMLVFLLVIGIVGGYTAFVARKYTAMAAVVLDVKSPDPIAGVVLPGMMVSGYMATQVDVLRSERVLLRAIKTLHLDEDKQLQAEWEARSEGVGDYESWLADIMLKSVDAKPAKDSNVVFLSYTARDPDKAAAVANAIVKAYIDITLELRVEPAKQFNNLFDESTRNLRDQLKEAQARLSDFQRTRGIVASGEKLDVETSRLSELSTQLIALQASANDSAGRQSQAGKRADSMAEVLSSPMVNMLAADLARQESRLTEMNERLGDKHPQVMELRANNDQLRQRIAVEKGRITGSLDVNNNINQSKLAQVRADVAAQHQRVLEMKGLRDEAAVLQRDVDNAQRVYDAGFAKLSQSTLESQATQTNVSVLKIAKASPFPSSPKVKLNMAVAILLGSALAAGFAVLREMRDWRLRTDDDVVDALKMPLLGVLPDAPRIPQSKRKPLRLVAERVLNEPSLSAG